MESFRKLIEYLTGSLKDNMSVKKKQLINDQLSRVSVDIARLQREHDEALGFYKKLIAAMGFTNADLINLTEDDLNTIINLGCLPELAKKFSKTKMLIESFRMHSGNNPNSWIELKSFVNKINEM